MQKTMKRTLALILAVVLCFSAMPFSAFAVEMTPDEPLSSQAPTSEAPTENSQPEPSTAPETGPESSAAPEESAGTSTEPSPAPSTEPTADPSAEPTTGPDDPGLTPGTELDMNRVWPALRRAQARAAGQFGTDGTLYVGDYCFPGGVGTPPTLGEYIGPMPIETMRYGSNNVAAFCIEHEKESGSGMGYTWMDLSTNNQETLGTILALGFQWNAASPWAVPSDNSDKWVVTQVLIWETIAGHAFVQGNGLIGIESGVDADMQMISAHAYNPTKFMEYYRNLKKRLNDYFKVPSFANKEASKADTITLRWDGSKYSATVNDSQGVLASYNFRNAIPGVQATANGNKLTLSATEPILTAKTSSAVESNSSTVGGKGAVAVWRIADRDFQDFGTYNADGGDPVMCYIKVKTDAVGSAGLVKTSEDGKVEGIQFQITGSDSSSITKITDANGNIDIEGLPIYSADGSKITYTATEINVPNKYVKPESQTFQLTEGQTVSIRFENKLKRWRVTVTKSDEQTGSTPQGNGSLAGAKYGVYRGNELVKEYITDENGQFTTDYYPYGEDWTLREISASPGYLVSEVSTKLCEIPAGSNDEFNDNTASVTETVMRGGVSIEKRDSKTGEQPQGDADFSGIQFEIVNKSKNPVEVGGKKAAPDEVAMTITTNAQGMASTGPDVLPYGDYLIRESKTNASMLKTFTEEIPVTVSENGKVYTFTAENDVVRGGIAVEKRDSQTGERPQGNADFSGITFEIINDSRNPVIVNDKSIGHGEVALALTTDSEGKASTAADALPYGSYILHESATNESMLNTAPDQPVEVTENGKVYPFFMDNEVVRGGVLIEKRDLESKLLTPLGGASLDGTLFEITNKSRNAVYVNGALYQPDEVCLTIEVKDGVAQSDVRALPYGSYELAESKPGTGYLWTDKTIRPFDVLIDGSVKEYREGDAAYNQVKRGDLKFVKVGEKNMHRFANVAFKLTSQTTGESHILLTDANGEVRTETKWNAHSLNTNGNDDKPEAEWNDETGTWFGKTTEDWMVETQDGLCALPFDKYTLEELRCAGNEGYQLVTVPDITISRDSTVIELGTIDDHEEGMPEIGTTATVDGEKISEPLSEVTIVDTVRYSGLTVGKTYKLSGVLMDKATGEPLTVDGKQVTAEKEFTPKSESGTEELSYTFSASALAGKSVVVFEDLYEGENKVASHTEIEDEGQTVTFTEPKIGTTATSNGEHTAEPFGEITIIDTVAYSGLIPGKEYTVKGVLMDKTTGEKLLVDGKEITAEATFRAGKAEGTIDIPFTFDASALAGKTVVVFETLYRDKLEVCAHADIEDKNQTVTFSEKPEIKTTATVNGEKKAEPAGEVTITDTVSYTGLTPGKAYKLSGVLMDKASGAPLLVDGQQVTAEKEFTPESASGTEKITFTFDASALAGKSVVVFETLYHEGKEVAVHADINDLGQTVEFTTPDKPEIKTEATINGEKEVDPLEEVTIIDKVSYSGLIPGKQYRISGVLMDKGTGEKLLVEGKEVTSEVEFTPETPDGAEEIPFTFNASTLAGKTIVVFETLYQENVEVFVHADINDKSQTITIRGRGGLLIKKTAEDDFVEGISFLVTGKDYSKKFKTDKNGEIRVDNLVPGEYTVTEISDKATARYEVQEGKTVTVTADGKTAEVKFHNKLLRGQIVGRKTDTEGNPLEGVLFGLFPKDAKEFPKDKAVATAKTDKNGRFEFSEVPYGDWQIVELEALPGYVPLDKSIKVAVDSSTVTLEDIQNAKTKIVISKVDSVTGKELAGAKLEIKDKDGKVIESWTTDGKPHIIDSLPAGEYVLHEASAPDGYLLAEDVKFTVKDTDEGVTVVMKDRPKDVPSTPNTGDRGWLLALAVFGVSLGGVVISLVLSRKKKKEQD